MTEHRNTYTQRKGCAQFEHNSMVHAFTESLSLQAVVVPPFGEPDVKDPCPGVEGSHSMRKRVKHKSPGTTIQSAFG